MDVWKKSMDLVDSIYKVSKSFPNEELYSLTNQMRREEKRREERQFLFLRTLQKEQQEVPKMNLFNLRKLINGLIYSLKRREK